jgi:hypothetical protein
MPAHTGGEVVEAEEIGQRLGLTSPPLHRIQHCQLPVQQGLTAHGDVQEDLVDPLAHSRLVHGGPDGRPLHRGERLRDLGYLLDRAGVRRRGLRYHVHVVASPESFDHARQPLLRHAAHAVVEPGQVTRDLAAEPHKQDDRDNDGKQPGASGEDGLGDLPVGERRGHRRQGCAGLQFRA